MNIGTNNPSWKILREIGIDRAHNIGIFDNPILFSSNPSREFGIVVDRSCQGDVLWKVNASNAQSLSYERLQLPGVEGRLRSIKVDSRGWTMVTASEFRSIISIDDDSSGNALVLFQASDDKLSTRRPTSACRVGEFTVGLFLSRHDGGWEIAIIDNERLIPIVIGVELIEPVDISALDHDTFLITDSELCSVFAIHLDGSTRWKFGTPGRASEGIDALSGPVATTVTPEATILVCDYRNDRVIELDSDGNALRELSRKWKDNFGWSYSELMQPHATAIFAGKIFAIDGGGKRIIQLDRSQDPSVNHLPNRHLLSFPRSVHRLPDDSFVVSDTNNDRLVRIKTEDWSTIPFMGNSFDELKWPRCAVPTPSGILIADSLNRRILEVDLLGNPLREFRSITTSGNLDCVMLCDPHDVRVAEDGGFYLADAGANFVAEVDSAGVAKWWLDARSVHDPHQVIPTRGGLLIIDSSGILWTDSSGIIIKRLTSISASGRRISLAGIKGGIFLSSGDLIVYGLFEGISRLIHMDIHEEYGRVIESRDEDVHDTGHQTWMRILHVPRSAFVVDDATIVLTDYAAHRVLILDLDL